MDRQWYKRKTVWTGVLGGLTVVAGVITGTLPITEGIPAIISAFTAIFLGVRGE